MYIGPKGATTQRQISLTKANSNDIKFDMDLAILNPKASDSDLLL